MQCPVITLDTTGTTYTFYEIEKRKKTKGNENKKDKSEGKKEEVIIEETKCRAPRGCGRHLKRTS